MRRKNHIGFYFDNKYFFEGGYDQYGLMHEGLYSYDLITKILKEEKTTTFYEPQACHSSVQVGFKSFSDLLITYKEHLASNETNELETFLKTKENAAKSKFMNQKKVYVFGGINEQGKSNNLMRVMSFQELKNSWKVVFP